jgi:uncharacterized protein (DUF1501 family)
MKRRNFIKLTAPLAVVPFFSNQLFAAAMPHTLRDEALLGALGPEMDRVLVVIQMSGGNDGLNMVLPMDQYTNLAVARANILIPDTAALILGSSQTGLHPAMTGLRDLFDQQKLSVVQSVGYASQNFSHFRSQDIWQTGSNAADVLNTGWMGRYLEYAFPDFPDAYPNAVMPDPLSIRIGSGQTLGLQGTEISTGQNIPTNFNGTLTQLTNLQNTSLPAGNAGIELAFLRDQQQYTNQYGTRIVNAWTAGTNLATYPTFVGGQNLSSQLKIVARLIKGGLQTRVYWVSMGGFDTHSIQVTDTDHTKGVHTNLLKELSDCISIFQQDLQLMGLQDRVIGFTHSEFGRRIKSNASAGTDHGAAAPLFVFGSKVAGGIIGANPIIPANASTNATVSAQFDFKSVYQSILQYWFCMTPTDANANLGYAATPNVPINGDCLALPVELARFLAERANETDAQISWTTASENGTETFEIERSSDEIHFKKVGEVPANGHAHEAQSYTFLDKNLPTDKSTIFYYRLNIKDLDGTSEYSDIRSVVFDSTKMVADIFPNPSSGPIVVAFKGGIDLDNETTITINDISGRLVSKFTEYYDATSRFELDFTDEPEGVYFVSILNGEKKLVKKVMIKRN